MHKLMCLQPSTQSVPFIKEGVCEETHIPRVFAKKGGAVFWATIKEGEEGDVIDTLFK